MKQLLAITILALLPVRWAAPQQGRIDTGTNRGVTAVRVALPEFSSNAASDAKSTELAKIFNQTLWDDLEFSGSIELISRSFYPLGTFANPGDIRPQEWTRPGVDAEFIVFGAIASSGSRLNVDARLWDLKLQQTQDRELLGNRYGEQPDQAGVRMIAHRLADDILEKLGFGKGVARTKITFSSNQGGGDNKEIYVMDYDGNNVYPLTSLKSLSLFPNWAPDGEKIAFSSLRADGSGWDIRVVSRLDRQAYPFPLHAGLNTTPAWSPDGSRIAFSSSRDDQDGGEIYIADSNGRNMRRLTHQRGADTAPTWNPRTGQEIAFVSDRTGTPQIYRMDVEGSNVRRVITEGGAAVNPAWSPDGQTIAFAWQKARTSNYDIYLHDLATGVNHQITQNAGNNERPTWAPDGKHLAFQSNRSGTTHIYSMLANGTKVRQLTRSGTKNEGPNWSAYIQ